MKKFRNLPNIVQIAAIYVGAAIVAVVVVETKNKITGEIDTSEPYPSK